MRKLSVKNKFLIALFSVFVGGVIVILVSSVNLSRQNSGTTTYDVASGSVMFDEDTNKIDTTDVGYIKKTTDDGYYYTSKVVGTQKLGIVAVVYSPAVERINLFGDVTQVNNDGSIKQLSGKAEINVGGQAIFYKLADREYLIVANRIYSQDQAIFASKYLLIDLDKQGNASLLNDAMNVKTINPMILTFDDYSFDVANEKLTYGSKNVDLALIGGSTNEYAPLGTDESITAINGIINSTNELIDDFSDYAESYNHSVNVNNQLGDNFYDFSLSYSSNMDSGKIDKVENKTEIAKRASLRGAVAGVNYIDINYAVTDPENKYQSVFLNVTGISGGEVKTQQLILDKYDSSFRLYGLEPSSEYNVSLGYNELNTNKELVSEIEDTIILRTTAPSALIKIIKIAEGEVYFNLKMGDDYAIDSGDVTLYGDGNEDGKVEVDVEAAKSEDGFSGSLPLSNSAVFELRLENTMRGGEYSGFTTSTSFAISV